MVPDMSGLAILILIVMGVLVFANFLLPFMAGVITGIVSSKSTVGHGAFIGLVVGGVAGVWNALVIIGDLQSRRLKRSDVARYCVDSSSDNSQCSYRVERSLGVVRAALSLVMVSVVHEISG